MSRLCLFVVAAAVLVFEICKLMTETEADSELSARLCQGLVCCCSCCLQQQHCDTIVTLAFSDKCASKLRHTTVPCPAVFPCLL